MKLKRKLIAIRSNGVLVIEVDILKDSILMRRQKRKCFYCGKEIHSGLVTGMNSNGYTRDHLFPKCFGNPLVGNKVLSCTRCNTEKGNRCPTKDEVKRFLRLYHGVIWRTYRGNKNERNISSLV